MIYTYGTDDTVWDGKPQSLKQHITVRGHKKWIPRGLTEVLKERDRYQDESRRHA